MMCSHDVRSFLLLSYCNDIRLLIVLTQFLCGYKFLDVFIHVEDA